MDNSSTAATSDSSVYQNQTYKLEQDYLSEKASLCNELGLYDIQTKNISYELRLWNFPSMWDPSILYVLKRRDSVWTLFHYEYYKMRISRQGNSDSPVVDSVVMESLIPRQVSWDAYIYNLRLDSLWYLTTESAIKGKQFDVLDGSRSLLEIREGQKYKYLVYTMPQYFKEKDINHKKFVEFRERLVQPVLYNGMRNP